MRIDTLSTFPGMFDSVMGASMMRIAQEKGILEFQAHDLRDWTHDRHRTTDDEPYGGGHGLVMKCEPIFEALDELAAAGPRPHVVFLAPQGERFDDAIARRLAGEERLLFVCGHYEGIDERAYTLADSVLSIGDYVLTSGELAAMVVIDAVVRKLPGVLGAELGAEDESFNGSLLEYPQYTRPASYRGMDVPAVLRSGDHGAVDAWRHEQSLERTWRLRPDLLQTAQLDARDAAFLKALEQDADGSPQTGAAAV
jgi:tRNA (guanine37-N1)-methyltransferase